MKQLDLLVQQIHRRIVVYHRRRYHKGEERLELFGINADGVLRQIHQPADVAADGPPAVDHAEVQGASK